MAFVTVDEIVRSLLGDEGRNTTHEYLRLLHIANRGLKELTFDVLGSTKVAVISIDSNLKIDLPGDYIDYTYIGMVNSDYQLEPLAWKTNIPANGTDNKNYRGPGEYHYVYGGLFGVGGGQNSNGYYVPQIDVENWQMIFGSVLSGQTIYLEYTSDGRQEGGQNFVHPYAEEALISWTYWKSIARKRGIPMNDKLEARREYYNQKRLARARMSSFTKEEALQQFRKGFKQAPKV